MRVTVVISIEAREIMSKRLVFKLAVMVAALSAVTLLPGCGEDDDVVIGGAWMPAGAGTLPMMVLGTGASAGFGGGAAVGGGGGGQNVMAATAGAVASGAGGGGGQVSAGGVP